mgnify:CR=1 FL=1
MPKSLTIKKKLSNFKKSITVSGDKSISIRWVLFSSLANGVSEAENLLNSEDVIASINAIRKLGIKVRNPFDLNSNEEFEYFKDLAIGMGFLEVASGPMVRSSYRADRIAHLV